MAEYSIDPARQGGGSHGAMGCSEPFLEDPEIRIGGLSGNQSTGKLAHPQSFLDTCMVAVAGPIIALIVLILLSTWFGGF